MSPNNRRKSICLLTNAYPDDKGSYRGIFVKALAERLIRRGYEIWVVTPRIFKKSALKEYGDGRPSVRRFRFWSEGRLLINYRRIPWFRMATYFLAGFHSTWRTIRKHRCSLIHAHWVIPTGLMGVLIGKTLHIPVIVHARGSDIHTFSRRNRWIHRLTQFTLKNADCILAVSDRLKRMVAEEFGIPPDRIKVSMNGVDTSLFRPLNKLEQRRKLNLPLNQTIVLFVGGLVAVKGLRYLIKAVSALRQLHGDDLLFVVVGEGELDTQLLRMTRESEVQGQVRFVGSVPNDQIARWMNAADVFILPSLSEGMPNAVLEAQACGLPVVATRVGGTVDVIQDGVNGLLIEPADSESIVEKLNLLMGDRGLYEKLRSNARVNGVAYSADGQVTALEKLYELLCEGEKLEERTVTVAADLFP